MILDQKTFLDGLELSPCPFCNERDIRIRVDLGCGIVYVECMQCHAQHSGPDKREAVANWNRRPETYRHDWQSREWEGSKEQAEDISRMFDAVLDALIEADAWTSHEPWKGKTAVEQVKIFIDRATAAEKELEAVKRELANAALWSEESDKTTTPSVQVYVLHQKLIERADECRDWDRRYEAAIKTMGIITRHRNELEAEVKRLQEKAPQPAQTTREKQPLPKPRIPIRPLPHNSGGKFDAKRSIDTLNETVEDLVSAVNDLQRWACE